MNAAIVTDPKKSYADIQTYLASKKSVLANVAPKYLDTERMIRLALGASSKNHRLLQCTPQSWLMALMDCAFYGLEPNPVLGHAYLVPYQNNKNRSYEVSFMPGYRGLILLACEHGGFEEIDARVVYSGEMDNGRFEETPEDPIRPFRHRPLYEKDARGDVAGVYAIGWRGVDKRPRFKFLTVDEVNGYRERSRSAKDGPWVTDWQAMAQKTAVRRMLALAQTKPGGKLGAVLEQDNALDRDELVRAQDWQVEDAPKKVALADKLAEKARLSAPDHETDESSGD